ncbi:hypothetical protein ZIOFF_058062 [Zingiber officinale]|uniref:Longin domain-containing protein n=1 Tax=Zingiber officinale TaxID=94328 RepID=A0A8J5KLJ8_ZINOF|nr:hypothetical protein ZIOFF_058062 [Zingiber officinale]
MSALSLAGSLRILRKIPAPGSVSPRIATSSTSSDQMGSTSSAWPTRPLGVWRVPFMYLEDIHMRFMKNYGKVAHSALAYAMNVEFSRVLYQQMEFFSSNTSADTLNCVRGEVSEASLKNPIETYNLFIHTIMVDDIDKILDRGDRLAVLVDKTATIAVLTLSIILLLYIIAACCGGIILPSCRSR